MRRIWELDTLKRFLFPNHIKAGKTNYLTAPSVQNSKSTKFLVSTFLEETIYSRQMSRLSSVPSSQSGSPSQCHLFGTHWPFWHTKSASAQVFLTGVREKKKKTNSLNTDEERERETQASCSLMKHLILKKEKHMNNSRKKTKVKLMNMNCSRRNQSFFLPQVKRLRGYDFSPPD